jgi:hypothetical protein
MADRIIDGTQLNVNNIMYSAPKATPQGAKSVNILISLSESVIYLSYLITILFIDSFSFF